MEKRYLRLEYIIRTSRRDVSEVKVTIVVTEKAPLNRAHPKETANTPGQYAEKVGTGPSPTINTRISPPAFRCRTLARMGPDQRGVYNLRRKGRRQCPKVAKA